MKTIFKRIILVFLFFYLPFASMAWGVLGHRIVAQIAESYLTPNAKNAVYKILGTESMAIASNWPDFIKSDPDFAYLSPWHYVNLPAGESITEIYNFLETDTAVDAYTKINFCIKQLQNKKLSAGDNLFYLRLLIHIVGDVHQPLHVGLKDDQGGNQIKVTWFGVPSNLHRVWDEQLINFQQLSFTEYSRAINHTTIDQANIWQKQDVRAWIFDSYQSVEKIYADISLNGKLGYEYNFKFIDILNHQLLKGGVRLAGLLNKIFSKN